MRIINLFIQATMPVIVLLFALTVCFSKTKNFESFEKGVLSGLKCCKNLLPSLLLVMCGVSAMFSSGAVDILCYLFRPITSLFGIHEQMVPSLILRPFSGSAVTAVADKMFEMNGADSIVSKISCLLMGSTDTIIYTLSVYFSSVKIKRTRYAIPASFIVFVFSIIFCNLIGGRCL